MMNKLDNMFVPFAVNVQAEAGIIENKQCCKIEKKRGKDSERERERSTTENNVATSLSPSQT